jgi:hypothetical protein
MATIVTRVSKGSALTWTEGDDNITNLNTDKIELTNLSVSTASASAGGSLSYSNTTGVFTFTPADVSGSGLANVVEDTTPQLGGNLDVNGNTITSNTNGDIELNPDGTGKVRIDGIYYPTADGTANQVLQTDGAGNLSFGSISLALDDVSDVTLTAPSNGQVLNYNGSAWVNSTPASGGIANVVEDTTPQLGGELDGQGNTVSNVNLKDYKETNFALTYGATITPDVVNGNVQTVTLTDNVTFNAFGNPETGQSLTLIVKQDGTGSRTLTSTMKFAGADKTLSTAANAIDIISVFYDGTDYYASLAKGFA